MVKLFTFKNILLISLFLSLTLLLRWNSFLTPFERDEGEYAYSAWIMRQGVMPYQNSFLQKPPIIIYTYMIGQELLGDNLWAPRILAVLFILAESLLLYGIVYRDYGEKTAWFSIFIFVVIVSSPINASLAANTEIFMLLPFLLVLYIHSFYKDSRSLLPYFTSGIFTALAILYKPICLYAFLFIYLYWFYGKFKLNIKLSEIFKDAVAILFGVLLSVLIIILPFLIFGSGKYLWDQVVVFNSEYASHWGYGLGNLFINLTVMAKSFWIVYVLFLVYCFFRPKKWKFILGFLFFSLLGSYQTTIRHYLIIIMPALAIISALAIILVIEKCKLIKYEFWIFTAILLSIIWPVRMQFSLSPEDLSIWIYGTGNPFYEAPLIANKITNITKPSDCIFVAGSEAEIYYYAKRFSCTKYVITYPLIVNTADRLDNQNLALNEIKNTKPKAIIFSNRDESGLWNEESPKIFINFLNDFIRENYTLSGGYVWGTRGGSWLGNLSESNFKNASLLLYKLK